MQVPYCLPALFLFTSSMIQKTSSKLKTNNQKTSIHYSYGTSGDSIKLGAPKCTQVHCTVG